MPKVTGKKGLPSQPSQEAGPGSDIAAVRSLTPDEIRKMLAVARATQVVEIDCDACLNQIGEFAEMPLLGKPVSEGQKAVEQHLSICNECREEFEGVCQAIKGLDQQ